LGVLPGIIGTLQANEVIKIVLGFDHVLSGKLFCFNAKTSQTSTLKINRSDSEIENVIDQKVCFHELHNDISCSGQIPEKSFEDVLKMENIQFIDVREMHEQPQLELQNCIQIPLGKLEQNLDKIDSNKTVVLFCQTGIRSKQAVELLNKHNISICFSLKGGITEINKVLK
jgi:adenylyltransferase/sulfurtransferase